MKLSEDLPRKWIITKALLFGIMVLLSFSLLLTSEDWRIETFGAMVLMWASARLYYFCFYVISNYLDSSYHFTGLFSSLKWIFSVSRERKEN